MDPTTLQYVWYGIEAKREFNNSSVELMSENIKNLTTNVVQTIYPRINEIESNLDSLDKRIENLNNEFSADRKYLIKDVFTTVDNFTEISNVSQFPYIIKVQI